MSKFIKIAIFALFTIVLVLPFAVSADRYGIDATATKAGLNKSLSSDSIPALVGRVVQVALSFVGILFFLLTLYAGFNWMLARGNSEAVEKSKTTLEHAVIGLLIVAASYAISSFVFSSLTGGETNSNTTTANSTSDLDVCCIYKDGTKKVVKFPVCNSTGETMSVAPCQ